MKKSITSRPGLIYQRYQCALERLGIFIVHNDDFILKKQEMSLRSVVKHVLFPNLRGTTILLRFI